MGSGKTTFLESKKKDELFFGYSFYDLDHVIFEKWGSGFDSLRDLIEAKGFNWFRDIERQELINIWKLPKTFTSLGGGTLSENLVELILSREDIKGFFLNTDFEVCLKRIMNSSERPLGILPEPELRSLYNKRLLLYKKFESLS